MSRPRVLLVGWDSADWQVITPLMDRGELPLLRKLVESGVKGNLATLSPMLWTSIATGKRAYDHGVLGFTDVDPLNGAVRPVSAATRWCKTVWEILGEQGLKAHVVGWFSTHGEQRPTGITVSNLFPAPTAPLGQPWPPAPRGTIWPETLAAPLNEFRVSPEEVDASWVERFVPGWEQVDQAHDHRLGHLREHVAESLSIQAAATWILEHQEWDFLAVYFRAIDELSHHFMPFHPPQLAGVPDGLFNLYQGVINSAYQFHELMLAKLIALAGPETHVILVSDHGFHSGTQRPKFIPKVPAGITVWHRSHGVLAAAGPQFQRDELVFGASLLDVTPTILALYGLPVGDDMEGKVLATAFREPPVGRSIPTWETPGAGRSPAMTQLTDAESRALLEHFVALGYLEPPGADPTEAARLTEQENRWTLARANLDGNRPAAALPLLQQLHRDTPARTDFTLTLARCQMSLGLNAEARATMDAVISTFGNAPITKVLRAQLAADEGDYRGALSYLEQARSMAGSDPDFWLLYARTLVGLRRWSEVEAATGKVLAEREDDAAAWLLTAMARLRIGQPEAAEEAALNALNLEFTLPRAHFILGLTQWRLKRLERAEKAWLTCLRYAPGFSLAHHYLQQLYRRQGRTAQAEHHGRERQRLFGAGTDRAALVAKLRAQAEALAPPAAPAPASAASTETGALAVDRATSPAGTPLVPQDILVVTGLPRSGTSLLMQLLGRGGFPLLTDGERTADVNNPEGYLEWEPVRQLRRNPRLIDQAAGRAVKVISALLPALPHGHRYRFICATRPLAEIARSQHRMRFPEAAASPALDGQVLPLLEKHAAATREFLRQAGCPVLEVDFPELVRHPAEQIARLLAFVGAELLPTSEKMLLGVKPELHRQRVSPTEARS
jgi:predicted AlkP superfamily phosphohydrolase/phosphomutase/tetratricopeptide (TPR) repeat protein